MSIDVIKTEALTAFTQVAFLGSFTAAANHLGLTTMAISKQVAGLEKKLAEPLFERTTRKVKITQFGEEFLLQAEKILKQHDSLDYWLESRHGEAIGTLRVVAQYPEIYQETIFPWIAEFCETYPKIQLEFDIKENIIDIGKDQYDIYWGVGDYLGEKHSGLKRRSLWCSQYGIYASNDYIKKYGMPLKPDDLDGHNLIGYLHNQPNNILVLNKMEQKALNKRAKTTPDYRELNCPIKTVSGLAEIAVQGLGIINAPADDREIKRFLKKKKLVPLLENYWWPSAEIYLYYQQVKLEQSKVRVFIDYFLSKKEEW